MEFITINDKIFSINNEFTERVMKFLKDTNNNVYCNTFFLYCTAVHYPISPYSNAKIINKIIKRNS